jgi:hypothetical protein
MVRDHLTRKPDGKRGHTGEKVEMYRCKNYGACERKVMVTRTILDPYVTAAALQHLGAFEYDRTEGTEVDVAALEAEVAVAEAELADLVEGLKTGAVSSEMAIALTQAAEARRDEAKAALRDAPQSDVVRKLIAWTPEELGERFGDMKLAEQRALLGALIAKITVQAGRGKLDERVDIEFKPLDLARLGAREIAFGDGGSDPPASRRELVAS